MAALKKDVITDTLSEVKVHYLTQQISTWWNARRSPEDLHTFCGWYWVRGNQESGPFRTRSAALRDAYYQFVLHQRLPKMWTSEIPRKVLRTRDAAERPRVSSPKKQRSTKVKQKTSSWEARTGS